MKTPASWKNKNGIVKYNAKDDNQERDFESTMQALKKSSGHTEYRVIPMRCDKYDKPYSVVYKRAPDHLSFFVDEVIKDQTAKESSRGIFSGLFPSNRGVSTTYDQNEFCHDGRYCPWCGHNDSSVFCNKCGELYCGSKVITLSNGNHVHECVPRCGARGVLSTSSHINGHQRQNKTLLPTSSAFRIEHKTEKIEVRKTIRQEITHRITKK